MLVWVVVLGGGGGWVGGLGGGGGGRLCSVVCAVDVKVVYACAVKSYNNTCACQNHTLTKLPLSLNSPSSSGKYPPLSSENCPTILNCNKGP